MEVTRLEIQRYLCSNYLLAGVQPDMARLLTILARKSEIASAGEQHADAKLGSNRFPRHLVISSSRGNMSGFDHVRDHIVLIINAGTMRSVHPSDKSSIGQVVVEFPLTTCVDHQRVLVRLGMMHGNE